MPSRFEMLKQNHWKLFQEALEAGKVDKKMVPFIEMVFSKPDYYTTTTCSGRIVLLRLNDAEEKRENNFFAKWHEKPKKGEVWKELQRDSGENIWFKQEPFVMVIGTNSLENAHRIMTIARNNGVKKVGLMSFSEQKYLVEINGTHFMSFLAKKGNGLLVDEKMLEAQLDVACKKLEANWKMLENFQKELEKGL